MNLTKFVPVRTGPKSAGDEPVAYLSKAHISFRKGALDAMSLPITLANVTISDETGKLVGGYPKSADIYVDNDTKQVVFAMFFDANKGVLGLRKDGNNLVASMRGFMSMFKHIPVGIYDVTLVTEKAVLGLSEADRVVCLTRKANHPEIETGFATGDADVVDDDAE